MPHPKNHMKLTGDTHPPEVEYDQAVDDDALDDRSASATSIAAATPPLEGTRFDTPVRSAAAGRSRNEAAPAWSEPAATASARAFTRTRPVAALGITLVAGYALLKLARR